MPRKSTAHHMPPAQTRAPGPIVVVNQQPVRAAARLGAIALARVTAPGSQRIARDE